MQVPDSAPRTLGRLVTRSSRADTLLGGAAGVLLTWLLACLFIGGTRPLYAVFGQATTYPIWYGTGALALLSAASVYALWLRRFQHAGRAYMVGVAVASLLVFWVLYLWPSD